MIFVCLVAPLSMVLFIFKGKARVLLSFLLSGIFMCLLAGEINALIRNMTELPVRFLTVNITPITEEILKAIPVVFALCIIRSDRRFLPECAIAVGVGFATMENVALLFDMASVISAGAIIARGLGAGMMHGISTLAVGYALMFVSEDSKLFYTGTVAALSVAIIYHSIYNIAVQSDYPILGILLPIVTYIPLLLMMKRTGTGRSRK